jgi:hypothetical protein
MSSELNQQPCLTSSHAQATAMLNQQPCASNSHAQAVAMMTELMQQTEQPQESYRIALLGCHAVGFRAEAGSTVTDPVYVLWHDLRHSTLGVFEVHQITANQSCCGCGVRVLADDNTGINGSYSNQAGNNASQMAQSRLQKVTQIRRLPTNP